MMHGLERELRLLCVLSTGMGFSSAMWGCASDSSARTPPANAQASLADPHAPHGWLCPVQVPGTRVTSNDVEGGTALDFQTSSDHVADMRQRVREIAAIYNHHESGDALDTTASAQGANNPRVHHDLGMPVGSASVEEIAGGARLVLRPDDPSQLQALRERARIHTGRVVGDDCEPPNSSGS